MKRIKLKIKSSGFVLLFAVTLAAILLSIALGVSNVAFKELKFSTSAKDTNEAFFAADTGMEQAFFTDKIPGAFPPNITTSFSVTGLGNNTIGCANVDVKKETVTGSGGDLTKTTVTAKGYNVGSAGANCSPSGSNAVERELVSTYYSGSSSTAPALTIGQNYQGGIIFYIDETGQHGLISATSDQGTIRWYNGSFYYIGQTSAAVGTGLANTTRIISSQGAIANSYAAGLARAYSGDGYTDWYLPSKDELDLMYSNIGPGATGVNHNIGNFITLFGYYWSSSEMDAPNSWYEIFDSRQQAGNGKNSPMYVRAIRSF